MIPAIDVSGCLSKIGSRRLPIWNVLSSLFQKASSEWQKTRESPSSLFLIQFLIGVACIGGVWPKTYGLAMSYFYAVANYPITPLILGVLLYWPYLDFKTVILKNWRKGILLGIGLAPCYLLLNAFMDHAVKINFWLAGPLHLFLSSLGHKDIMEAFSLHFAGYELIPGYKYSYQAMVISAGIYEEFFYRGLIYNMALRKYKRPAKALALSSFFFSLGHGNLSSFPAHFISGLFFGWSYMKTGSLIAPVIVHTINNAVLTLCGGCWHDFILKLLNS
ncbi:CPBP family intramembrane metalloprotease [Candidatus Woesearchaeota archaeon]|nr:CPBP family intramembrane metalloprotease [Candidatus Woesearchaeota archaeon]